MVVPLEEVMALRRKVVALETAESDNERLRKELSKLKITMQEEKSQVELEFMNQLSTVMRENALKLEEVTGRLQESNNVNRALSEKLRSEDQNPCGIEQRFQDMESRHENEISKLMAESNRKSDEIERMKRELSEVKKPRDESVSKLDESENSIPSTSTCSSIRGVASTAPVQLQDFEIENRALKEKLEVAADSLKEKERTILGFEDENRRLKNTLQARNKDETRGITSAKPWQSNLSKIEEPEEEKCVTKERNERKVTHLESREDNSCSSSQLRQCEKAERKENRASRLIKQFERKVDNQIGNRVRGEHNKVASAHSEVKSLKADIKRLHEALDNERKSSTELRQTVYEFTTDTKRCEDFKGPRHATAVQGIVKSMEQRMKARLDSDLISVDKVDCQVDSLPSLATELNGFRKELKSKRDQVQELERELANQCEINSALLKEMSNLTSENELIRSSSSQGCRKAEKPDYGDDQKEIDRLTMEVAKVKSRLFNSNEAHSKLKVEVAHMRRSHQDEVERFKLQLARAELNKNKDTQVHEIKNDEPDQELIRSKSLLVNSEARIKKAEDEATALRKSNSDLKKVCESLITSVDEYKSKISELEANLKISESLTNGGISAKEAQGLNLKLQTLEEMLLNAEESRASLTLEKEQLVSDVNRLAKKKKRLEEESKHQTEQLKRLQETLDEKLKNVEDRHHSDQREIKTLQNQVVGQEEKIVNARDENKQLQRILQERQESANVAKELSRKTTNALLEQINDLENELEVKVIELSEIQPKYQTEFDEFQRLIKSLNSRIVGIGKERDEVKRKYKNTLLDKESTSKRLEKEKQQLVLSMQDMIENRKSEVEELQNELMTLNSRFADQAREISNLKATLEDSDHKCQEMDDLKRRLVELSRQLTTKEGKDNCECMSLQDANSEGREKLEELSTKHHFVEKTIWISGSVDEREDSLTSPQILREHNAALDFEKEKLTEKLRDGSKRTSENSQLFEIDPDGGRNGVTRMVI